MDGGYSARKNPIEKCYQAAKKRGFHVFPVQNGALKTFADLQLVYCPLFPGYKTIGCYKDTSNRAIPTLEDADAVLDGSYPSRKSPIAKCTVAAMRKGYSMFAVQNGGWSAASATAPQTFEKYGKSSACKSDGEGGGGANQVYVR